MEDFVAEVSSITVLRIFEYGAKPRGERCMVFHKRDGLRFLE